MSRSIRARAVAAAAAASLVLALAGCNGDDPKAEPDPTPSSSSTASPSTTAEASPTGDASPTVAPATGPLLKMPNATINAPQGYKPRPGLVSTNTEANPPEGVGAVRLSALPTVGPELPLDVQAKNAVGVGDGKLKRLPDVEIAGVTFYHLAGSLRSYSNIDVYGVDHDGYQTGIQFEFMKDVPDAERQQTIAEGLASFVWL
jgi:hypothetical protein